MITDSHYVVYLNKKYLSSKTYLTPGLSGLDSMFEYEKNLTQDL